MSESEDIFALLTPLPLLHNADPWTTLLLKQHAKNELADAVNKTPALRSDVVSDKEVPLSTFLGLVSNDDPYKTRYFRICGSTRTLRQNIRKGYLVVKLLSERISRKRGDVPRMEEMLTDTIRANNVLMGYLDHYEAYVRAVQRVPMVSREGWRMARRHEEAVLTVGLLGKDEKVREIGEAVDVVDRGMCDSTKLEKRGAKKS